MPYGRRVNLLPFLLALAVLWAASGQPAGAQDAALSDYWSFDAPAPIERVAVDDLNGDGIQEFVIVASNGEVLLLNARGEVLWRYTLGDIGPFYQLATLHSDPAGNRAPDILLVTADQLHLLSNEGQLLWQQDIALPAPPDTVLAGDSEVQAAWLAQHQPRDLAVLDGNGDGGQEIALVLASGLLQYYDGAGNHLWNYETEDPPAANASPLLEVGDVDGDGAEEILFSYFGGRFSKLVLLDSAGEWLWDRERPVDGRSTALALVSFAPDQPLHIAVGNSLGRVHLYDENGNERWFRTPNKTVTSLAAAELPAGPALLVGTEVGTVTAYSGQGDRYWRTIVADTPNRAVTSLAVSPVVPRSNQPAVAVTLSPNLSGNNNLAEVYLLDSTGQKLQDESLVSVPGATQLVNVNQDALNELFLVGLGTVTLSDSGTGARKNTPGGDYRLLVQPQAVVVADLDEDGREELLLGAADGRLHLVEGELREQATWIQKLGDDLPLVDILPSSSGRPPIILAVSVSRQAGLDGQEQTVSEIHLLDADGRPVSTGVTINQLITRLVVAAASGQTGPQIIAGTDEGILIAYTETLDELWRTSVGEAVAHLTFLGDGSLALATNSHKVYLLDSTAKTRLLVNCNLRNIVDLLPLPAGSFADPLLLILADDGTLRGLTGTGREAWHYQLEGGPPTIARPLGDRIIIGNEGGRLFELDNNYELAGWTVPAGSGISALIAGDLNGGGSQDVAAGRRDGNIGLYSAGQTDQIGPQLWDQQQLNSPVYALVELQRGEGRPAELVAISDLGVVQLFEAKPNRPPLLVNPQTSVQADNYQVSVDVIEEDGDTVEVTLELFDEETGRWIGQGVQSAQGSNTLVFQIEPSETAQVRYRFYYTDQVHDGYVEPAAGPAPIIVNPLVNAIVPPAILVLVLVSLVILVRQALTAEARTRRFYNRMKQQPAATLELLAQRYEKTNGAPGFLLNLANRARSEKNQPLANLADGLFLLTARPAAALPIINGALGSARTLQPAWREWEDWYTLFQMGQAMFEAPNVTELSLLRPQLWQLVQKQDEAGRIVMGMSTLVRVLSNLRDSERIDSAEDRLVYLHEATILLRQLREELKEQPARIQLRLVTIITLRWLGVINAAIDELRGQAQLVVTLKTRRLVPTDERTHVVLAIQNKGRAPAENVQVRVDDDPAYRVVSKPAELLSLSAGREQEVSFDLEPHVVDRFRLSCRLKYDDRSQAGREIAFADMVHLLSPVREFSPVQNPYLPGTPLRKNSTLFFGREELFDFIAQNAGHISQRNVLILVGQRRTGKTSALLRLGAHLPPSLLPVYIDCQSLGVVPGMAALFHDLAWLVSDALAACGIALEVPEPAVWRDDPAGYFQRRFMPAVRDLLPAGTMLLLVFDEFEAFENLVKDGILPPTFFTFLRHLMQHSQGLSFVFVGTRRLEEMSSNYWSVLFNIALYRQIDFLSREAATRLICEPVAPHIIYDDLALDKIWRVTAGHPYFLQLVCYTLTNQANRQHQGYITISDVNAAVEEMLRLGEVHFAYIWQRSSFTERALLTAVAHLMDRDVPFHPGDLVQYLEQYGFRFDPAEVTAGLNHLVEREIMQEITLEGITLYELKIGLVGLWVEQNKSLSKLYESSKNGAGTGRAALSLPRPLAE
jgi:hypothetical protein